VGVIFFRGRSAEGEIMKKEYVVDLNEQDLALGEEGYIETEKRKSGRNNTDNTCEQPSDHFPHLWIHQAQKAESGGEGVSRANP